VWIVIQKTTQAVFSFGIVVAPFRDLTVSFSPATRWLDPSAHFHRRRTARKKNRRWEHSSVRQRRFTFQRAAQKSGLPFV
jgi:hypothetical protein